MTSEQLDPTLPYVAKINVSLNIYSKSVTENDIKKKMNIYMNKNAIPRFSNQK